MVFYVVFARFSIMTKWSMDEDEDYFRIFDSKKEIAGYFDPEYPLENDQNMSEAIEEIIREHIPVPGGFLMVPMVKFGIFDTDYNSDLNTLETKINSIVSRINMWKTFLNENNMPHYFTYKTVQGLIQIVHILHIRYAACKRFTGLYKVPN